MGSSDGRGLHRAAWCVVVPLAVACAWWAAYAPVRLPTPSAGLPPGYVRLSAADKAARVWEAVLTDVRPAGWHPIVVGIGTLFYEPMAPTFEHVSDEYPPGREKVIHSVGAVALAEFVVTDNSAGYSGIFATGSVTALLRMSTAKFHGGASTCPGASMKFFRTGLPSVNAFAIDSVFSQQTCNFFAVNLTTNFRHPAGLAFKALEVKVHEVSAYSTRIGLSAIATHYTDGRLADNVSAPYTLTLVPNEQLRADMPHTCNGPVTDYFKAIPPGTIIFHVLGQPGPCSGLVPLGHIRITSALTTSVYADTKLFFQHQRAEDDMATRPEWRELEATCGGGVH